MNPKDERFTQVLNNLSRKLHKQGVGANKIHERVVTVFYCKPVKHVVAGKPWYFDMPVGHNILKIKGHVFFSWSKS